MPESTQNVTMF